jgi:hypothetical protein
MFIYHSQNAGAVPFAIPKSLEIYSFLRHSICEVSSSEKQGCLQRKLLVPPIPLPKHAVLDLVVLSKFPALSHSKFLQGAKT